MANEEREWMEHYRGTFFRGSTPVKKLERLFQFMGHTGDGYLFRQINTKTGVCKNSLLTWKEAQQHKPIIPKTGYFWTGENGGFALATPRRQYRKGVNVENLFCTHFPRFGYVEAHRKLNQIMGGEAQIALAADFSDEPLLTFDEAAKMAKMPEYEGDTLPFHRLFTLEPNKTYKEPLLYFKTTCLGVYDSKADKVLLRKQWSQFNGVLARITDREVVV